MTANSLAFRLIVAATIWTLIALPVTGIALNSLYRHEVERGFDARLEVLLTVLLASSLGQGISNVPIKPTGVGDELFEQQLTGWYWQVRPADGNSGPTYTSQSLFGEVLQLDDGISEKIEGQNYRRVEMLDPGGTPIRVFEREFTFGEGADKRVFSFLVSGNALEIRQNVAGFRNLVLIALSLLGMGLIGAIVFQVKYGLKPLGAIGRGLAAIRAGEAERLEGELPAEIVPLQYELNALIKSNQSIIERARTHVGNLAHALKTPLAVIINEAAADPSPFAGKVSEQARLMQTQINHYLDRARMAARVGVIGGNAQVAPIADALVRALRRIYQEKALNFSVDCASNLAFQGEKQDLEELLGNLLDNACKWARSEVQLTVSIESKPLPGEPQRLVLTVDDDGPGLTQDQRTEALRRGRRLDESKPGSGLGLSIVVDLADLYGAKFELDRAPIGGLRARLLLPQAR